MKAGSGVSSTIGTSPVSVVAHSPTNIADWNLYSVTPNEGKTVASYPGFKCKSFNLLDFWFGWQVAIFISKCRIKMH